MLINVTSQVFKDCFNSDPHPFLSDEYIELNKHKVDQVVRLIEEGGSNTIGLIGGIINKTLKSPFSAPFGGFHFNNSEVFIDEVMHFLTQIKEYVINNDLQQVEVTLPVDIYHQSINTKLVNSFIRNGYTMAIPEITNWIDLTLFDGIFKKREAMKNYRQAQGNKLTFQNVLDDKLKLEAFDIIAANRKTFNRPIYMTFEDLLETGKVLPIDFFLVKDINEINIGSAIFYRGHPKIVYGTFWGDTALGRPLRTMDFLVMNLYMYYKRLGFKYIDLGISTVAGTPNAGLIRFKETHNCISSLRFTFSWSCI
jgi:hypothetical protein